MKIAGIILAAGGSVRMGDQNKLLETIHGTPMIKKVVQSALNSNLETVYIIVGHEAELIRQCISDELVHWVENPAWSSGMASSIRYGIKALKNNYDGAMILLGDMPFIEYKTIDEMVDLYHDRGIIVPVKDGKQGNPVLFSSTFFPDLRLLTGDKGAKRIIRENHDSVIHTTVLTDEIFHDLDTPEQMKERMGA
ncbi:uncharacterized protein METZ01_LOCUS370132 [marine metagenome]|uniref:MobA-like NTP transferase domain-containing protein n=1 Tax=marine metagenome TaxID=408172 RepID=A0A382T7C8_9ZZZZ